MSHLGRGFIVMGLLLAPVGVAIVLAGKLGLGRLPGDIVVERKGSSFHFPIVTCVAVSLVLTVMVNLLLRRR